MRRFFHYWFVQQRHNWLLLFRFGLVGGSGFIVNLAVFSALLLTSIDPQGVWWAIPGTEFNVRNYHLFAMAAFAVANLWNFQVNRWWTFQSAGEAPWLREYLPFLWIGVLAQGVGLLILTLLLNTGSPIALPSETLDGSSLLRERELWAQAIAIVLVTPISFVLNKLITFRSVRGWQRETREEREERRARWAAEQAEQGDAER